ncbi:PqqD family protein [Flavobacteriales bacterium]|nr:PqqD family protein [Flavobacteriales bacterium]
MNLNQHYAIRNKQVINETLDNETIIINLESGVYYSLNPTATLIWKGIGAGLPFGLILSQLEKKYSDVADLQQLAEKFILFIELEQLIEKTEQAQMKLEAFEAELASDANPFSTPAITKYEDMQEMLLADPIHEVEEDGWPKLKK